MPPQIIKPDVMDIILQQLPTLRDGDYPAYCQFRLISDCGFSPGESVELLWDEVSKNCYNDNYSINIPVPQTNCSRGVEIPASTRDDLVVTTMLADGQHLVPAEAGVAGSEIALRLDSWLGGFGASSQSLWATALDQIAQTKGVATAANNGRVSAAWLTAWRAPAQPLTPIVVSGAPLTSSWMLKLHEASDELRTYYPTGYALYVLQAHAGLRPTEARALAWDSISPPISGRRLPGHGPTDFSTDFKRGYYNTYRKTPLSAAVMQALVALGGIEDRSAPLIPGAGSTSDRTVTCWLNRWVAWVLGHRVPKGFLRNACLRQYCAHHRLSMTAKIAGTSRPCLRQHFQGLK